MKPTLRHRKVLREYRYVNMTLQDGTATHKASITLPRDYQTAKARTKPAQRRSFGWLRDYARKIWSVYTARMEP